MYQIIPFHKYILTLNLLCVTQMLIKYMIGKSKMFIRKSPATIDLGRKYYKHELALQLCGISLGPSLCQVGDGAFTTNMSVKNIGRSYEYLVYNNLTRCFGKMVLLGNPEKCTRIVIITKLQYISCLCLKILVGSRWFRSSDNIV